MYRLIYVSSAVEHFSGQELEDLLKKCRENNSAAGLTGMLLYRDGNFMQCLEGPKDAVCRLELKIKADPRHRGMLTLLQEENAQPEFSGWAMGFKKLDSPTALEVPGYSNFLDLSLTNEQFQVHPSKSLRLLLTFRNAMR